jgi:hypothetical protein
MCFFICHVIWAILYYNLLAHPGARQGGTAMQASQMMNVNGSTIQYVNGIPVMMNFQNNMGINRALPGNELQNFPMVAPNRDLQSMSNAPQHFRRSAATASRVYQSKASGSMSSSSSQMSPGIISPGGGSYPGHVYQNFQPPSNLPFSFIPNISTPDQGCSSQARNALFQHHSNSSDNPSIQAFINPSSMIKRGDGGTLLEPQRNQTSGIESTTMDSPADFQTSSKEKVSLRTTKRTRTQDSNDGDDKRWVTSITGLSEKGNCIRF